MEITGELLRCEKWIQDALDVGGNTHDFRHIVDSVISGHMQLWAGEKGCAVTEIVVYPNKKVLHVFLAGGEMQQITDMEEDAVKWAKAQGCSGMTLAGRFGWKKVLKDYGWKPAMLVLGKEF